jgi:uncharacterized protein (TIGR02996 family)
MDTEENALLAAVAAAPTDDAPRLVYADWLQERDQDAKAEYVRLVVELMHPPERAESVERCVAVAAALDEGWRRTVGARFEVLLDGAAALVLAAHVVTVLFKLAIPQGLRRWRKGQPVRLRGGQTREEAEHFVRTFGPNLLRQQDSGEPVLRLVVRPMDEDSPLGLTAPSG